MSDSHYIVLEDRAVLSVSGSDRVKFLQGLVTNNVEKLVPGVMMYSALLTPNGRFLHDFFLVDAGDAILIDTEKSRASELLKRLSVFKLRADVKLEEKNHLSVMAILVARSADRASRQPPEVRSMENSGEFSGSIPIILPDPRHPHIGSRAILASKEAALLANADRADYEAQRLALGLPDGARDIEPERGFILEYGFEDLHGVDFNKGCYMGQEVVSRTKHTGVLRKFVHTVEVVEGEFPAPGTPVMLGEKEIGRFGTHQGKAGLALLRIEHAGMGLAVNGGIRINVTLPSWVTVRLGEKA